MADVSFLGGGFNVQKFSSLFEEDSILTIFQRGWLNHRLVLFGPSSPELAHVRSACRDLALLRHSLQIRLDALRVPWVALVSGEIRNKNAYPPSTETYNPFYFWGLFSPIFLWDPSTFMGSKPAGVFLFMAFSRLRVHAPEFSDMHLCL